MSHDPKKGERPTKKVKRTSRGTWTGKPHRGFMCGIAWDYEIGHTDIQVFPTLAALKASFKDPEKHYAGCGHVEVKITPVRRVPGTY